MKWKKKNVCVFINSTDRNKQVRMQSNDEQFIGFGMPVALSSFYGIMVVIFLANGQEMLAQIRTVLMFSLQKLCNYVSQKVKASSKD